MFVCELREFRMLVQDNDVALDYFHEKECVNRTVPLCQFTMSWMKSTDRAGVSLMKMILT